MLDADSLGSLMTILGPTAASALTTRYWSAHDDGDPRRHGWFVLYLGVVLGLLVMVLATTSPEDRLRSVGLLFAVTIIATAVQERRHRKRRRVAA
ncbi:hypothetical protein [Isoptericola aurantiacus]|uniref:hypothetical protein n=1 Tax=Isoptericola aurantiacus TaxID=3377839 RepID=UPI00383B41BE